MSFLASLCFSFLNYERENNSTYSFRGRFTLIHEKYLRRCLPYGKCSMFIVVNNYYFDYYYELTKQNNSLSPLSFYHLLWTWNHAGL